MRKIIPNTAVVLMLVMCCSCAKERSSITNDAAKRYFDAWIATHHPGAMSTDLGVYILTDEPDGDKVGDGDPIEGAGFLLVDYTVTDLDGNISSSSKQDVAEQLGTFSQSVYYGPVFWATSEESLTAGVADGIKGMRINGKRKIAIPGWLRTTTRYASKEEYLANVTENTPAILTITVVDTVKNMKYHQAKMIEKYLASRNMQVDSLQYGFYYKSLKAPDSDKAMPEDTTVYINYTGRLLMLNPRTNSYTTKVFDTTIEDTAKVHRIHSASKTYTPSQINWASDSLSITMGTGASSVIAGFSRTLWQMKSMEKGVGIFISDFGYGSYGSGSSIPGYAPLIFEVELVENK